MQDNVQTDVTCNVQDDAVIFQKNQQQKFSHEDFVEVYNDTVTSLGNVRNKIEQMEENNSEMLEQHDEALTVLHTALESEEMEDGELEANTISEEAMNVYQELKQNEQQLRQMEQRRDLILEQLESMRPAAEQVKEDGDELKEYE